MKSFLVILSLLVGSSAFAAGDAGCGLGSLVIKKNSKLMQLFASTTNGTFLSQPLGITFGTSGCSSSGIVMNEKQIQYFVEVNQEDLSREMAQGHGEKLSTLALLHGCMDSNSQNQFAGFTQGSYTKILPAANTSAVDMVHNLRSELSGQESLAQVCHGS